MRQAARKRLLSAVTTDSEAELVDGTWKTRCLHCRKALFLTSDGETTNGATLEHVIPKSWFDKRAATEMIQNLCGPDDARNLALACPRCNQSKGSGHDQAGPSDQRAKEVVQTLFDKRQARFKALIESK